MSNRQLPFRWPSVILEDVDMYRLESDRMKDKGSIETNEERC